MDLANQPPLPFQRLKCFAFGALNPFDSALKGKGQVSHFGRGTIFGRELERAFIRLIGGNGALEPGQRLEQKAPHDEPA